MSVLHTHKLDQCKYQHVPSAIVWLNQGQNMPNKNRNLPVIFESYFTVIYHNVTSTSNTSQYKCYLVHFHQS